MKRVLFLTHTDINSDSRILKEMEAVRNADFDVYGIGVESSSEEAASRINDLNISVLHLMTKRFGVWPKPLQHAFLFFKLIPKMVIQSLQYHPDIVHCNDTLVLPIGFLVTRLLHARLVYDAHELESKKNGQGRLASLATLFIERMLWKSIDQLIVVSDSIGSWYRENLGVKDSITILNSPVLLEAHENSDNNYFRKRFSIQQRDIIFLYIGILGRGRGLEMLIDVFGKVQGSAHLVMLGFGEYRKYLEELAEGFSNIHFHEAVPHERVVSIAKTADYGLCLIENVSLSDYLCLPNKLFEYCFAGLPIIASDFPEISRVVNTYNLGICCIPSEKSIEAAINLALSRTIPRFSLERLRELSWEAQACKLVKMYKSL